jgi:hypothetical protein
VSLLSPRGLVMSRSWLLGILVGSFLLSLVAHALPCCLHFIYLNAYICVFVHSCIVKIPLITFLMTNESASRPLLWVLVLEWQMIKELISSAKCETGKMSCEYIEAILSSRHALWKIRLHIFNVIKTRIISSRLSMYAYWRHKESCQSWWWLKKDQQGLGCDKPYIGEEQVTDLASRYRMWWRRGKWMFES